MASSDDMLQVSPTELKFKFELRKNIPVILSLTNPTDEKVAFKVKTTSPKMYCVRPSSGFVEPKTNMQVQVIRQAQKEMPALGDTKDKFLVQSARVASSVSEIASDLFDTSKNNHVSQVKLRVLLTGPPQPPSPVPEGPEDSDAVVPGMAVAKGAGFATNGEDLATAHAQLKAKYERAEAERLELRRQLLAQRPGSAGGLSLWAVLVVAFVAFLSGYLLK